MKHTELIRQQHERTELYSKTLVLIDISEFATVSGAPARVWRSRHYLVQEFREDSGLRLSVCRVKLGRDGRWQDGLSWDELQQIKHDVGYGDWFAYEVYPADQQVVNVANMRHLWLSETALPFGWNKAPEDRPS